MNYKTVLKAGFIAGTLDLLAALIMYVVQTGKNPAAVLKFIASGVFGNAAFTGGSVMLFWGVLFHFVIAFFFALFFFSVVSQISILIKNRIVIAIFYGILVWLVMNLAVVPLSNAPKAELAVETTIPAMLIVILCIGVPFSLMMPHPKNDLRREDAFSGSIS